MEAALNDLFKASFENITLEGEVGSPEEAFSRNIKVFEDAFGSAAAQWAVKMFDKYSNSSQTERPKWEAAAKAGSFMQKIEDAVLSFDFGKTSTAIDEDSGVKNAKEIDQLKADANAVEEGALTKILANFEPILSFLRQILKAILSATDKDAYAEFIAKAAEENAARQEENERVIKVTQQNITALQKRYGFSDSEEMQKFAGQVRTGWRPDAPNGMKLSDSDRERIAIQIAMNEEAVKKQKEYLTPEAQLGQKDVRGGDFLGMSKVAQRVVTDARQARRKKAEEALDEVFKYGDIGDPTVRRQTAEHLKAREEGLQQQIDDYKAAQNKYPWLTTVLDPDGSILRTHELHKSEILRVREQQRVLSELDSRLNDLPEGTRAYPERVKMSVQDVKEGRNISAQEAAMVMIQDAAAQFITQKMAIEYSKAGVTDIKVGVTPDSGAYPIFCVNKNPIYSSLFIYTKFMTSLVRKLLKI